MDADEIVPLTREAVRQLLASRSPTHEAPDPPGKRAAPRWPFPGAVEIWVPAASGPDTHVIATLHDLSEAGVGVRSDGKLEPGKVHSIAVHQPEMSLHGRATVRHCTPRRTGYHIGMQFNFD